MFRSLAAWHIRYRREPGCKGCPQGTCKENFSVSGSERPEKISVVLYIIKGKRRYSAITQEVREHSNEQERIETLYVDEISITQRGNHGIDLRSLTGTEFSRQRLQFDLTREPRISTSDLSGHDCNGRYAALRQDTSAQRIKARVIPDFNMPGHRSRCFCAAPKEQRRLNEPNPLASPFGSFGASRVQVSLVGAFLSPLEGLGVINSDLVRSIFQAVLVTASDEWSGSSGRPAAELLLGMVKKIFKNPLKSS